MKLNNEISLLKRDVFSNNYENQITDTGIQYKPTLSGKFFIQVNGGLDTIFAIEIKDDLTTPVKHTFTGLGGLLDEFFISTYIAQPNAEIFKNGTDYYLAYVDYNSADIKVVRLNNTPGLVLFTVNPESYFSNWIDNWYDLNLAYNFEDQHLYIFLISTIDNVEAVKFLTYDISFNLIFDSFINLPLENNYFLDYPDFFTYNSHTKEIIVSCNNALERVSLFGRYRGPLYKVPSGWVFSGLPVRINKYYILCIAINNAFTQNKFFVLKSLDYSFVNESNFVINGTNNFYFGYYNNTFTYSAGSFSPTGTPVADADIVNNNYVYAFRDLEGMAYLSPTDSFIYKKYSGQLVVEEIKISFTEGLKYITDNENFLSLYLEENDNIIPNIKFIRELNYLKEIPGYNASVAQQLTHNSSGVFQWVNI